MSFFTDSARADLAVSRTMVIDHSSKDDNGKKRFRILPWHVVEYSHGVGGIEPVSASSADGVFDSSDYEAADVDCHPTDIMFISDSTFYVRDGSTPISGGDVGFPQR